MLTISPFLVIDDNTINNLNERARKVNRINSSKLEKEPKSSTAQTKSIDMSQSTAYSRVKCTYPWTNIKWDIKYQSPVTTSSLKLYPPPDSNSPSLSPPLASKHQKGELLVRLSRYGEEAVRVVVVGRWTLGDGRELLVRAACWIWTDCGCSYRRGSRASTT